MNGCVFVVYEKGWFFAGMNGIRTCVFCLCDTKEKTWITFLTGLWRTKMSFLDQLVSKVSDGNISSFSELAAKGRENAAGTSGVSEDSADDADVDFFMAFDEPKLAHVTCDVLNVREGPSKENVRIGQLKRGAEIQVTACCDEWLQIKFNDQDAFVFAMYTDYEAPEYKVTASVLNIRKGPGTDTDKIGSLPQGTVVRALAENKGWVKILNGKQIGYVSRDYLA